jgi:hypothetical protein
MRLPVHQVENRTKRRQNLMSVRKKKRERKQPYTKGVLNRMIDDAIHPLYRINNGFVLVDGLLHGMVELNPPQSAKKFLKYNLPLMIKKARKLLE